MPIALFFSKQVNTADGARHKVNSGASRCLVDGRSLVVIKSKTHRKTQLPPLGTWFRLQGPGVGVVPLKESEVQVRKEVPEFKHKASLFSCSCAFKSRPLVREVIGVL